MTSQPTLLDGAGSALPGPQFVPRPGWGGQLRRWFQHNIYIALFRLVIVVALVMLAHSLWSSTPPQIAVSPPPTPGELTGFTIKARPGDGMTNLAARAVDLYIAVQSRIIRLDAAQHLFAVDTLARTTCWCPLKDGQSVSFTNINIAASVEAALGMTPAKHAAWSRLLK